MCPPKECPEGQCFMRKGMCCDGACQAEDGSSDPVPSAKQDEDVSSDPAPAAKPHRHHKPKMCAGSPQQMCKRMCPPKECPEGQCFMRKGMCCEGACQAEDGSSDPVPPAKQDEDVSSDP